MNTQSFKRLPCGNSNFESIITGNYVYIDKTRFIEELEDENTTYHFFIRPHKFGKSLFSSMLSYYYDINHADKFDRLFGDLYIGKNPTPKKNSYMVMQFDFSGLKTDSEEEFKVDFNTRIETSVIDFLERYSTIIPQAQSIIDQINKEKTKMGAAILQYVYMMANVVEADVFVIVDEYDSFAKGLIATGKNPGDSDRRISRIYNMISYFHSMVATGVSTSVDNIFFTGVSPIVTYGINFVTTISFDRSYNEALGFTKEEIEVLMRESGVNPEQITVNLEQNYNGYLFHREGKNCVYNPSMILDFFNRILDKNDSPKDIPDDNDPDYTYLPRLLQYDRNYQKFAEIIKDDGIMYRIIKNFEIERLYHEDYFVPLLFYMGLLAIDGDPEKDDWSLKVPNDTVKAILRKYNKRKR